jgi:glycosyltransferase involved in cell wall biosynthesis
MNGPKQLISCLMVTCERVELAKRAIRCYALQTYPNRELIIVTDGSVVFRQELQKFVAEEQIENIRFSFPNGERLPLGRLRNIAMDAAQGEILCQWDDDDCYHPERLLRQADYLLASQAGACYLTDHFQYFETDGILLWIDWTAGGKTSGQAQLMPGTAMLKRDERFRYPESGPYARKGEDSALLALLYDQVPVAQLSEMGYLYLYTFHGGNTFSRQHHQAISMACARPKSFLLDREALIRSAIETYQLPKPVAVLGKDDGAFVIY